MTNAFSWQNSTPLPCFIPYFKAKFACYSRCFLSSYFCIPECLLPFPFVSRYFLISLHGWSAFFRPFTFSLCVSFFFFFGRILLFIFFLYFTTLYWFYHTSTCICHRCTLSILSAAQRQVLYLIHSATCPLIGAFSPLILYSKF